MGLLRRTLARFRPGGANSRLHQELEAFADQVVVHDLPPIYNFWDERYLKPKFRACGFEGVEEFYLGYLFAACERLTDGCRFVSLGAGNCDLEIRLSKHLVERGFRNFQFECVELNPDMLKRGAASAADHGLTDRMEFRELDASAWQAEHTPAVILANHSLHHIPELETVFAAVREAIHPDGVFVTSDVIGRNGHMSWPEALVELRRIWKEMPSRYKYDHQQRKTRRRYPNADCSRVGNEGIRAQDILPLLLETFQFEVFVGFANLVGPFVDRTFGPNFDPESAEDRAFIDRVATRDEELLDAGVIKPTLMVAAMRTTPVNLRCDRHRTPEFCVRRTNSSL